MSNEQIHQHLSAEELQALLEGELPSRERARTEEHLASCARCSEELDAWRLLFSELGDLPVLAPREAFGERVMAGVQVPESIPLAARVRERLGALLPAASAHPTGERIQDFVEGLLPARQAARTRRHIEGCKACAREAEEWRGLMEGLSALPHRAPSEAFAERVMANVRVPVSVPSPAPAPAARLVPIWARALAFAGRLVPRTRKAWAALSGMAVTPAATLGLVFYAIFSHSALTPGALSAFLWWKANDLALATWHAFVSHVLESETLFQVYSLLDAVVKAPWALAGGLAVLSVLMGGALWVLYKNLIATEPADGGYAHVES